MDRLATNLTCMAAARHWGSVQRLIESLRLPCEQVNKSQWALRGPSRHGFAIELGLMVQGESLVIGARAGLMLNRDGVSHEIALALLELNDTLRFGSFRVVRLGDAHEAVLAHVVDLSQPSPEESLLEVCRLTIQSMERAVTQLYATDLLHLDFFSPPSRLA